MKIIIVGGVAGGASAAARLRRLDEESEIIIMERGDFISFANCGLPYYIGGKIIDEEALTLQTPQSFQDRFHIEVRVRHEVIELNPQLNHIVVKNLTDGSIYTESYDELILSPGAKPIRPLIDGIDSDKVFTLRNIPDTMKIKNHIEKMHPKSAIVVGGGAIGIEMAENLHEAGLEVTIVELADHLIAPLDFDMAADVQQYLAGCGITVMLNHGVESIVHDTVHLQDSSVHGDMIIMAVGVHPDTALAKSCGIHTNKRGAILVDQHMKTNLPHIYAVGDAVEVEDFITKQPAFIPLAGPANRQGRIAADNICGIKSEYTGTQGSAILKIFDMTVASTGIHEKAAKQAGIVYDKTYLYSASHASYYPGAKNMSIKILWEKETQKLIGAQIVGFDGVDKRMDVLAAAIRFGAKVTDLTALELCYAPPFGSAKDPVNLAGFVAENVITGKVKQFFWHDVVDLPHDGSVTLLDVRTYQEVAHGKIDNFIHIPLDSLREHLEEIPEEKPVYIHCHSGQRSYLACRILAGYGYDCYNLAGGYRLYEAVMNQKQADDSICRKCR